MYHCKMMFTGINFTISLSMYSCSNLLCNSGKVEDLN